MCTITQENPVSNTGSLCLDGVGISSSRNVFSIQRTENFKIQSIY